MAQLWRPRYDYMIAGGHWHCFFVRSMTLKYYLCFPGYTDGQDKTIVKTIHAINTQLILMTNGLFFFSGTRALLFLFIPFPPTKVPWPSNTIIVYGSTQYFPIWKSPYATQYITELSSPMAIAVYEWGRGGGGFLRILWRIRYRIRIENHIDKHD